MDPVGGRAASVASRTQPFSRPPHHRPPSAGDSQVRSQTPSVSRALKAEGHDYKMEDPKRLFSWLQRSLLSTPDPPFSLCRSLPIDQSRFQNPALHFVELGARPHPEGLGKCVCGSTLLHTITSLSPPPALASPPASTELEEAHVPVRAPAPARSGRSASR